MAKERGIFLEISARKGHCLTNGLVARLAEEIGAPLILNTDAHEPGDLISLEQAQRVARGAGLTEDGMARMIRNGKNLVDMVAQAGL
jgi:histidinol phosphatase-like PHP family hydrolase